MLTKEKREKVREAIRAKTGEDFLFSVSFDHPKEGKVFGQAHTYTDDAYAQVLEGRVIVEHAVYPASRGLYSVNLEKITPEKPSWKNPPDKDSIAAECGFFQWGGSPYDDYCSLEALTHEIRADENNPDDDEVHVNDMFQIPVADGKATYVVTRVSANRCDVEWRGIWNGDRYIDHHFGWGRRSCLVSDVKRYVVGERKMARIFSKDRKGKRPALNKRNALDKLVKEYEKNHGFPPPVQV